MTYLETRHHELRRRRVLMVNGSVTTNSQTAEAGVSARMHQQGYWGFAASSDTHGDALQRVTDAARRNAATMGRFGARDSAPLTGGSYIGDHVFQGKAPLSQQDVVQQLEALNAWCMARYPGLKSMRVRAEDEHHTKRVKNSLGADALNSIQRALYHITFTAEGPDGAPVELMEVISGKGSLADLDVRPATLEPQLDALYGHLRAKCEAVPARGGMHTVVLAPPLAGMLAHEAMGHPCEADIVLGGAVTGGLVGQRVASDLVSMIDVANHFQGQETMIPVYSDDEGTPSRDAVLIRDGILTEFMNSRETGGRMARELTGNARAFAPGDEPLVRMRNTVIVPGQSKLDDMIAGVDEGYYLMKTANGQADTTSEFMFGITLAYEIRNGKLGRAIKDTTVSGSAIKVLQTTDAVSDDLYWNCGGYCGKKQFMIVSMGGPALRAQLHVGGAQ